MLKFSCTCQNYNGSLQVSREECHFVSSLFRLELKWSNVKKVKLDTKQIKGVPTSVLVIGLTRNVAADDDDGDGTGGKKKKNKKGASKKYFFYGFQDLLSAEERIKATWEHWRQDTAAVAREAGKKKTEEEDDDNDSGDADDNDSTAARRANEDDYVVSTGAGAARSEHYERTPQGHRTAPVSDLRLGVTSTNNNTNTNTNNEALRRQPPSSAPRRRRGVDILVQPTDSNARKYMEWVLVESVRCFSRAIHYLLQGGIVNTLLLIFIVCISVVTMSQMRVTLASLLLPAGDSSFRETRVLLNTMQGAFEQHRTLGLYASVDEYHDARRKRQLSAKGTGAWVERLECSARELAERYVHVQAKMLNLRSRRAERFMAAELGVDSSATAAWRDLFQQGDKSQRRYYLADPSTAAREPASVTTDTDDADDDACDDASLFSSAACRRQQQDRRRARSFSMGRVLEDLRFWRRIVRKTASLISSMVPFGWSLRGGVARGARRDRAVSPLMRLLTNPRGRQTTLVRYTESFLDGFDLVQYVTAEEEAERRQCLEISHELVQLSTLINAVFVGFSSLFMADTYERMSAGEVKPHFWGSSAPPSFRVKTYAAASPTTQGLPVFSSDEVLRVIFVRRYLDALLHLNPLEPNEHRRRAEAVALSARLREFVEIENDLSEKMNRTNKDAVLEAFYDRVMPARSYSADAADTGMGSTLRNTLEEMTFWHHHEDLWMEHLLHSLPPAHRQKLHGLATFRKKQQHKQHQQQQRGDGGKNSADASASPYSLSSPSHHVFWRDLPIFKGLLCFTPQPRLQRRGATDSTTTDVNAGGESSPPPPQAVEEDEEDEEDEEARCGPDAGQCTAATRRQGAVARRPSSSGRPIPPPVRSPYGNRYAKVVSAEEEFRRLYDPTRLENAVGVCKARWMAELDTFLDALTPSGTTAAANARHTRRRQRAYHLDQVDETVTPELTVSRARFFALLERLSRVYVLPIYKTRSDLLRFLETWCWPPSWLRRLLFRADGPPGLEAIRHMATADPAVQLAAAQIVDVPWGTDKDAPLTLLKSVMLQPPELLKLRVHLRSRLLYAWLLLIVAVVLLLAVYMFL